jgi:hypothetical protein
MKKQTAGKQWQLLFCEIYVVQFRVLPFTTLLGESM